MAYTRAWSNITPAGSNLANTADDEIRNVRLDTYERMNTLLGGTQWATDPVVDWTTVITMGFDYTCGCPGFDRDDTGIQWWRDTGGGGNGLYVSPTTTNVTINWNIGYTIPVGCTITSIKTTLLSAAAGGSTFTSSAFRSNLNSNAGATAMGSTITRSPGTGWEQASNFSSTYLVAAGDVFSVCCVLNNGSSGDSRLYGIVVSYTRPNILTVY